MIKTNKGAMFGLDARIALAIFGVLSVISGAALYSAIQDSNATAFITEMNEVGKAYESYLLDTGQDLPRQAVSGTYFQHRETAKLVSSSANGWKGPYLSYEISSAVPKFLSHPSYGNIGIVSTSTKEWGDGHATGNWYSAAALCSPTIQCYLWIQFSSLDTNHEKIIDAKIDNGDGAYKGDFRWYTPSTTKTYMLKYIPIDY
ncbi:MAG TPA: hypothetical protein DCL21_02795 [Alphaproteobacteria bacterium]|nr:hypothetical protein [Alphaproteobacteria bacterium]